MQRREVPGPQSRYAASKKTQGPGQQMLGWEPTEESPGSSNSEAQRSRTAPVAAHFTPGPIGAEQCESSLFREERILKQALDCPKQLLLCDDTATKLGGNCFQPVPRGAAYRCSFAEQIAGPED